MGRGVGSGSVSGGVCFYILEVGEIGDLWEWD